MDDLGDLLYFVILIGFSIIGALAKKKKKQSEKEHEVPTSSTPNPWEELEKRFREEQEVFVPSPHKPTVIVESKPISERPNHTFTGYESFDSTDDISKLRVKKQMKESISQKISSFKKQDQNQTVATLQEEPQITFENTEEIKKAIIYSEIFGRKFF